MHCLCHVGPVLLCLFPPAMPSQFESLSRRPADGGRWGQRGQGFQTTWWGGSTVMLKISSLSPSLPCLCLFALYSCVCLCASCRFQRAASNPDLPKPLSRRKKTLPRCSAPKGWHNVTFDQFLFGHKKPHTRTQTHAHTQGNLGILKWFVLIVADISVPLWSTHDFDAKKGNGWFQVKNHQKKRFFFFCCSLLSWIQYLSSYSYSLYFHLTNLC